MELVGLYRVIETVFQLTQSFSGAMSDVLFSRPIHVYGENVAGKVHDGRHFESEVDFTRDDQSVAISFSGFESPACGIRSYEWALGNESSYLVIYLPL